MLDINMLIGKLLFLEIAKTILINRTEKDTPEKTDIPTPQKEKKERPARKNRQTNQQQSSQQELDLLLPECSEPKKRGYPPKGRRKSKGKGRRKPKAKAKPEE